MARMTDDVLSGVGPRLRALRQRRDLTLAAVAEETGISISTLSRLEAGQRRPTLELLLPLARLHRVALDDLVGAPESRDPRVHATPIHRRGRTYVPLTRRPGGMRAYKVVLPPEPGPPGELQVHEGHEWVYVLTGRLRLLLGDRDLVLTEGEVAEFDTRTPHALLNPGPGPTELLTLFGPQGERMQVRARTRRVDDAS